MSSLVLVFRFWTIFLPFFLNQQFVDFWLLLFI
ncbi:hypothetical protein SGO_0727 [Streptococcus gordonii str. Challis substr. CH1]|uniref:Uncharacterized protein n=1 Tax=Streptococcus gordonii (strain Challis / ATCC 35105 / BCRC 15272 / CH1 / DL1 / V288) TaxID=467705 RepID=A8AW68_STRGC|nr:hypothetical protein SGO_0727 [Streptococcus gordonii str. Challis substr. CH1]